VKERKWIGGKKREKAARRKKHGSMMRESAGEKIQKNWLGMHLRSQFGKKVKYVEPEVIAICPLSMGGALIGTSCNSLLRHKDILICGFFWISKVRESPCKNNN
jgi:hypothetical protein